MKVVRIVQVYNQWSRKALPSTPPLLTMQAPLWGDDVTRQILAHDGDGGSQTHTWNLTTELITTVVQTLANLQAQEQEHWTAFHLPSNWRKFLANRQQKHLLITFLSTDVPCLIKDLLKENQTLVIAGGLDNVDQDKAITCTKSGITHNPMFTSNHEEGDSRVWFHACQTTCQRISIYSPDTDTYHIGLPLIAKEVMVQLSMKTADQVFCNITAFAEKLNTVQR